MLPDSRVAGKRNVQRNLVGRCQIFAGLKLSGSALRSQRVDALDDIVLRKFPNPRDVFYWSYHLKLADFNH